MVIGQQTRQRFGLWAALSALLALGTAPAAFAGAAGGTASLDVPGEAASTSEARGAPAIGADSVPVGDVTIYVVTNATHSDLVIPRDAFAHAPPLIKSVVEKLDSGPWIVIGWGPYWFGRSERGGPYHAAPWLVPNAGLTLFVPQFRSRIRFAALHDPGPPPREDYNALVPIRISAAGLERAIERMNASFETGSDGAPILSDLTGAAPGVLIYRSKEFYHLTHECNHWVAEVLHAGGLDTSPMLDLTPGALKLDVLVKGAQAGPTIALGRQAEPEERASLRAASGR